LFFLGYVLRWRYPSPPSLLLVQFFK
jgi:hypothetical protein